MMGYTHLIATFLCSEEVLRSGIRTMEKAHAKDYMFEILTVEDYGFTVSGNAEEIMYLIGYMAAIGSNTLYSVRVWK